MEIWDYLVSKYKESGGWVFIPLSKALYETGMEVEEAKRQLNELFKEKKVRKRQGFNGTLIELNAKLINENSND